MGQWLRSLRIQEANLAMEPVVSEVWGRLMAALFSETPEGVQTKFKVLLALLPACFLYLVVCGISARRPKVSSR